MTWFDHVRDSHSCRKLSVNGTCPSLVTSVVQMPIKTIPKRSKPAFGVLPKTGDAEPEEPGKPGWERSRTICARSILAWRWQGDTLGIDRHGVHSWRQLRLLDRLWRERERWKNTGCSKILVVIIIAIECDNNLQSHSIATNFQQSIVL